MALTFCLGDCVANCGTDVMHAVVRENQGQAEKGQTIKKKYFFLVLRESFSKSCKAFLVRKTKHVGCEHQPLVDDANHFR